MNIFKIHPLQEEYLACAIALSTAAAYSKAYKEWEQQAQQWGIPPIPVQPLVFGNFIAMTMAKNPSLSKINILTAAVADKHWSQYCKSPTEDPTFRRLITGIRRKHAKPPKSKAPLTLELLHDAFHLVQESGRLQQWRTLARINVEFYAGLRWGEVSALNMHHLQFNEFGLIIQVDRSKTDQLGRGDSKPIIASASASTACPVEIVQRYVNMLKYPAATDGYF